VEISEDHVEQDEQPKVGQENMSIKLSH